jgi:RNA polymerase sigma-70 factor (ECF subfamily)
MRFMIVLLDLSDATNPPHSGRPFASGLAALIQSGKNLPGRLQRSRGFFWFKESPMPPAPSREDVTHLLVAAGRGESDAAERLFPIIFDELHRLASSYMRRERADHTLQPTALVNEAFLRLVGASTEGEAYENRAHFIATAAVAMRRILVNHAKAKRTAKRGGGQPIIQLDEAAAAFEDRAIDLVALDDALDHLAQRDSTQARIVELRFFGGLTVEQCAELLDISPRTVHYEWAHARAWLRGQMESM